MKKLENKLILLLADPSVRETEINRFVRKLKNGGVENCFSKALKIRKMLKDSDEFTDQDWPEPLSDYERKIMDQVDKLLRSEAGMTAKDAIKALGEELNIKIPSGKRSFHDRLLYVCKNSEGSQIINAAYKIRNMFVHDSNKSDWPLKDK